MTFTSPASPSRRAWSQRETLREVLDSIYEEIGPPTDERRAWARHALGLDPEE
jgi:hypothetical protein